MVEEFDSQIETFDGYSATESLKNINAQIAKSKESGEGNLEALLIEKERFMDIVVQDHDDLVTHAFKDPLTDAYNRRYFNEHVSRELAKVRRDSDQKLCLIYFDLDHFKNVNDELGHIAGDEVLKYFVKLVHNQLRDTDVLGRDGGEEFILAASETDLSTGTIIAERIRSYIERSKVPGYEDLNLTVSIGVVCTDTPWKTYSDLKEKADEAIYQAKETGRNKVVAYKGEK